MTWRTARSLDVGLDEINRAAPRRSKISDGSIGDTAHSSRVSDHNPNPAGVVRARDFTHDPANGFDCNKFAAAVGDLLGKHPALGSGAYVIWNRRIKSTDRLSEGWRPYTGSNPHDKHAHVSVATAASGYDNTQPWGVMGAPEPEDDMASPEVKQQLNEIQQTAAKTLEELRAFRRGKTASDKKVKALLRKAIESGWDDATKAQAREILAAIQAQEDEPE